jgi:hypothetical protein
MIADCRAGSRSIVGGSFERDDELLALNLDAPNGDPVLGELYFVCAHSKRDVCCAVLGRPLAAALDELRPGQVYECSHTGGHRFAPNVLVAPSGLLYGKVDDAAALVSAVDAGVVLPALLRGAIGYEPAAQTALAFGFTELGLSHLDELAVVSVTSTGEHEASVRLSAHGAEYDVAVHWETRDAFGLSCAKPWPDTIVAYEAVSLT